MKDNPMMIEFVERFVLFVYTATLWVERLWWLWLILLIVCLVRSYRSSKSGDVTRTPDGGTLIVRNSEKSVRLGPIGLTALILLAISIALNILP